MCDTLIATKLATTNNIAIFGKNSDRPPNESQHIAYFPAAQHPAGSSLKCTYIEIPQVEKTNAVLLSKPFWMWGAEMGVNEHGLVIGNEAVFSKIPANKKPAMLGMDMLRAALERAVTAREALQVIIDLLEEFGQGGNCTYGEKLYYHNSFIIANAEDAWVLETVDKQWAARQIKDVYSISNCLTIKDQWDMASPDLVELAVKKGFSKSRQSFDLAKDYSDFLFTNFGKGRNRRATTFSVLGEQKGKVSLEAMMSTLRHHNAENFDPQNSVTEVAVCMHAGFGPIRVSQTTASMVVYLDKNNPIIFATGTSAPCTSIFKPFWMDAASSLNLGPAPTHRTDSSLYWTHEKLHRATLLNYPERIKTYAAERDEMEKRFIQGALKLQSASAKTRADFTDQCLTESLAAEAEWLKRVKLVPARKTFLYSLAWNGFNKKAGMRG
ncbi:MAG: C69 family dipeptidase [Anaerolineales bacterium]|nr:C69 family dipeptidase [Anaerolineales bacterium]